MKGKLEETRQKAVITYFTLPGFVRREGGKAETVSSRRDGPNPTIKMSAYRTQMKRNEKM
jgi:hypothetical protein